MRASYNGYYLSLQADDAGSIPLPAPGRADMAQLVERTLGKGESQFDSGYQHHFFSFPFPLLFKSIQAAPRYIARLMW